MHPTGIKLLFSAPARMRFNRHERNDDNMIGIKEWIG
jgi:hypothetical protein